MTFYEAWQIHRVDGREPSFSDLVLTTNIPLNKDDHSQLLVKLEAASLNYRDVMIVDKPYTDPTGSKVGLTPGSDGAGKVVSAPPSSRWKVGDEVILVPNTTWLQGFEQSDLQRVGMIGGDQLDGSLRQYAVIASDDHLIAKPPSLSFEEAASIPTAGGTAVHALFHGTQPILPGSTIVTQGTGGVSIFAIQLAAAAGATVIATSSSDEKLKIAKQAGATHLINYKTSPDWDKEVLKLTGGRGADFILDVGGPSTFVKSLAAVKTGGEISVVGLLGFTPQAPSLNEILPPILIKGIRVKGVCSFSRAMVQQAVDVFVARGIQPVVGKSWAWQDAQVALENLASGQIVGKSVVRIK